MHSYESAINASKTTEMSVTRGYVLHTESRYQAYIHIKAKKWTFPSPISLVFPAFYDEIMENMVKIPF